MFISDNKNDKKDSKRDDKKGDKKSSEPAPAPAKAGDALKKNAEKDAIKPAKEAPAPVAKTASAVMSPAQPAPAPAPVLAVSASVPATVTRGFVESDTYGPPMPVEHTYGGMVYNEQASVILAGQRGIGAGGAAAGAVGSTAAGVMAYRIPEDWVTAATEEGIDEQFEVVEEEVEVEDGNVIKYETEIVYEDEDGDSIVAAEYEDGIAVVEGEKETEYVYQTVDEDGNIMETEEEEIVEYVNEEEVNEARDDQADGEETEVVYEEVAVSGDGDGSAEVGHDEKEEHEDDN
ncbi:uncharacterized protein K441DRAFT_163248 [Cenococcum geophilum 1.58]|uniref:uncharacterized protein n=1 Tax=Cenococcum geophilum 1.58 TaxID=794803 RepID=UPI00358F8A86|nr:hypothetical protein K441DRAFT_163248 [Cenococcum geophilum 1.58]